MRFVTILTAATAACAMGLAPRQAQAQGAPAATSSPSPGAPAAGAAGAGAASAGAGGAPSAAGAAAASPAAEGAPPSAEDAKLACIASFEEAQRERNAGHYLASRNALIRCSEPQCGEVLASECTRMYAEVEAATPSVVFSAHDAARNTDRSDVSVTMNGKPLLARLEGKPLPLDPGQYELTFSAPGVQPVTVPVVIRTGEKYRVINVVFPAPQAAAPPRASVALAAPTAPPAEDAGVPVLSYVLGGLGVAGLGTFVALRVIGSSDYDAMKDSCAPDCLASDVDDLELKYLLSNVALGVGVASLGAAVVIYAVAPSETESPAASVALVPTAGGTRLVFDARF